MDTSLVKKNLYSLQSRRDTDKQGAMGGWGDDKLEEGGSLKQQPFRMSLDLGSILVLWHWQ